MTDCNIHSMWGQKTRGQMTGGQLTMGAKDRGAKGRGAKDRGANDRGANDRNPFKTRIKLFLRSLVLYLHPRASACLLEIITRQRIQVIVAVMEFRCRNNYFYSRTKSRRSVFFFSNYRFSSIKIITNSCWHAL